MIHPLSINVTFPHLSEEPFSHEYLESLREHFIQIRSQSRIAMGAVSAIMALAGGAFLIALNKEAYDNLALIDWLMLLVILICTGFIVWGVIDDHLLDRHKLSIRVNGVEYARRIHESMRKNPSFLDEARIDNIPVVRWDGVIHRFVYTIIDHKKRHFVGLDRAIILDNLP